jgi:Zn-finger nucleic acid-binding protein
MEKVSIARVEKRRAGALVLDHCTRCGGVWFEEGEVEELARHRRETLLAHMGTRDPVRVAPCHQCRAPLSRTAVHCDACGRPNELPCPRCEEPMRRVECGRLVLDACERCRGVWFDHEELEYVWRISVRDAAERHPSAGQWKRKATRGSTTADVAGGAFFDGLFYSPELMFYGTDAAVRLAMSAGEGIASGAAAEAMVAAVEIVGDASAGVFDVIADIIGSIFDGW